MANLWRRLFKGRKAAREPEESKPVRITVTAEVARPDPASRTPTPRDQRGTVYRSEYLPREREAETIKVDDEGKPNLRLKKARDTMVLEAPGSHWINPYSPTLRRLGVTIFKVRGVSHYENAARAGDFRPETPVTLVREPDNEHDPNAVAVYARGADRRAGYVNKQNARRLAKIIDSGGDLAAIAIRGASPGQLGSPITVLVTAPDLLTHLRR